MPVARRLAIPGGPTGIRPRSATAPQAAPVEVNPVAETPPAEAALVPEAQNPRAVQGDNTKPMLQELAQAAVAAWKAKNEATKAAAKAEKALEDAMVAAGERHVAVTTETGGVVDVSYAGGTKTEMDVNTLASLVDRDTLLRIVTASATKVEGIAGKDIANRCKRTKDTAPGISFAVRK